MATKSFLTKERHGYNLQFSPFTAGRILVASSLFYGLAGGGSLHILDVDDNRNLNETSKFNWSDGLFDLVCSEVDENLVATCSGDGSLQLWNISNSNGSTSPPLECYSEHTAEVYSIDWNQTNYNQQLLSSSWDSTIKLWDPNHDCLRLWNVDGMVLSVEAHDGEVSSCAWNRWNANVLATACSNGLIRVWDNRRLDKWIAELDGSVDAIRRIQFSPFDETILAAVGYDFTTRLWDYKDGNEPIEILNNHSEVVYGVAFNPNCKSELADCGWDSLVQVYEPKSLENY